MQIPFLQQKYSNIILLLQNLGIRHDKFTWPTCTCPIMPENRNIKETWNKIKQNLQNTTTPTTENHRCDEETDIPYQQKANNNKRQACPTNNTQIRKKPSMTTSMNKKHQLTPRKEMDRAKTTTTHKTHKTH